MLKLIVANLKSNKTQEEMQSWTTDLLTHLQKSTFPNDSLSLIIAPTFPALPVLDYRLQQDKHAFIQLATQDISPFPAGSYTGAVSTRNLEGLHVTHTIVGHSERRRYFHETHIDVANKVREALAAKITPILCLREEDILDQAAVLESDERKQCIVAFEPQDHIGTGIPDTLEDILKIKEVMTASFGSVPYLYGGSIDAMTDKELLQHPDIDGFLVGSASLTIDSLFSMIDRILLTS